MTVQKYTYQESVPVLRGRGISARTDNRFAAWQREAADGAYTQLSVKEQACATELFVDTAKRVMTFNRSPDIYFDRSINPYRGCEHGCSYCFARPSHAYFDFSPGLDFETKIVWKPDAPALLRAELAHPAYRCAPVVLGANTDVYQPVERHLSLTRGILEVLAETRHPVQLITKSALIERDIDLLCDLSRDNLVEVLISVTTLDDELAYRMEPRAPRPARRLTAMTRLVSAGIPVGIMFAPLIPALNDHEMTAVMEAGRAAGAQTAGYSLLRLPRELGAMFETWLQQNYPDRARHVMNLLKQIHGGRVNDPRFGHRMRGQGAYADLYRHLMRRLHHRLGFQRGRELSSTLFHPPQLNNTQIPLF